MTKTNKNVYPFNPKADAIGTINDKPVYLTSNSIQNPMLYSLLNVGLIHRLFPAFTDQPLDTTVAPGLNAHCFRTAVDRLLNAARIQFPLQHAADRLAATQLVRGSTLMAVPGYDAQTAADYMDSRSLNQRRSVKPSRQYTQHTPPCFDVSVPALVCALDAIAQHKTADMPAALVTLQALNLYPACRIGNETKPFDPVLTATYQQGETEVDVLLYNDSAKWLPPAAMAVRMPDHMVYIWHDHRDPDRLLVDPFRVEDDDRDVIDPQDVIDLLVDLAIEHHDVTEAVSANVDYAYSDKDQTAYHKFVQTPWENRRTVLQTSDLTVSIADTVDADGYIVFLNT